MEKTKLGLPENIESALAYSIPYFAVLSGLILYLIEDNKKVRFHAMQSFILFGFYAVCSIVLNLIPFLGDALSDILNIISLISWLVLIINAMQGKLFKFPIIGEIIYDKIEKTGADQ